MNFGLNNNGNPNYGQKVVEFFSLKNQKLKRDKCWEIEEKVVEGEGNCEIVGSKKRASSKQVAAPKKMVAPKN